MSENGLCKLHNAEEKDNRPWPDTSGGQCLHLGKGKKEGKTVGCSKGADCWEKKHKVGLMEDHNPRTGRTFLR